MRYVRMEWRRRNSGCDMSGWNVGGGEFPDAGGRPGGMAMGGISGYGECSGGMAAGGIPDAMCPDGMAVEEFRMRYVRVE